jgi:hypothetical protein
MSASAPVQLNIVVSTSNGATVTTSTIVVAIPSALQTLDSGNATGGGVASGQTGFSGADQLVRSIFRAGVFTDGKGNWYSSNTIQSITAS